MIQINNRETVEQKSLKVENKNPNTSGAVEVQQKQGYFTHRIGDYRHR